MLRVRNDGVPMLGFTWYSLTDQVDWDTALREDNGHVNALGLYDLDRHIRPVGTAYKQLIADWREVLPTQSVCLQVPIVLPSEHDGAWAQRRRRHAGAPGPSRGTEAPHNARVRAPCCTDSTERWPS